MTDIGLNNNGFFCFTDIIRCCRYLDGSSMIRDWYFPNNTRVPNRNTYHISRNRGPRTVILLRDNTTEPNGVYRCDTHGTNAFFGIYPENKGSYSL